MQIRIALLIALAIGATSAHADAVSRSAGMATPNLADFSSTATTSPKRAQYGNTQPQRFFLETFAARCTTHGVRPGTANFHITVRKLAGAPTSHLNTQLAFWDQGRVHFSTMLWTANEAPGTTRTFSYNLAALPPHGGMVTARSGAAANLLRDGDFSFSVYGAATVVNARLDYRCTNAPSTHAGAGGHVAPVVPHAGGSGALPPHSYKLSWGSLAVPVACPRTHVKFGRTFARRDALIARMQPELDKQCVARGLGQQFVGVTLESCSEGEGEVGRRAGNRTFSLVTCAP